MVDGADGAGLLQVRCAGHRAVERIRASGDARTARIDADEAAALAEGLRPAFDDPGKAADAYDIGKVARIEDPDLRFRRSCGEGATDGGSERRCD